MFLQKKRTNTIRTIEMILEYNGNNWILTGEGAQVSATSLNELDRKLERALQPQLSQGKLNVQMRSDNRMIPEWMRPYMNHYFNRLLELPLRY